MTQLFYELHGKFKTVTVDDVYLKKKLLNLFLT